MKEYLTISPAQTRKLGEILAKEILKIRFKKRALVIGLEGDLGGGKTTFLQGFARGLGIQEKILSPTFVIFKKFKILRSRAPKQSSEAEQILYGASKIARRQKKFEIFYHFDCYRIEKPKEILTLSFKKIISNPENIVAIEWANRAKKILPKKIIKIKFKFINKTTRHIIISS